MVGLKQTNFWTISEPDVEEQNLAYLRLMRSYGQVDFRWIFFTSSRKRDQFWSWQLTTFKYCSGIVWRNPGRYRCDGRDCQYFVIVLVDVKLALWCFSADAGGSHVSFQTI